MLDARREPATLPPLDHPAAFEDWRREVMQDQTGLEPAIAALERMGDLGAVRAAMMLVSAAPDRARDFATRALGSNDIMVHLLAEAYLAVFQTHAAWTGQATPKFDTRSAPIVLERILAEAKSLRDYSPFGREVAMRVHHMLADAYMIGGAIGRVREHAAEMAHAAFTLDLPATQLAANYYLAYVAETEGQSGLAENLFRSVAEDINAGYLGPRANRARARLLIRMGDEDGAEALLDPRDFTPGSPPFHHTIGLRSLTVRERLPDDFAANLKFIPNNTAALIAVYSAITRALECEPADDLARSERWREAHEHLRAFDASATNDSARLESRTLSAFIQLKLGFSGQAFHQLLPTTEIADQPAGVRAFAHVTSIEVLERLLPESADALFEALQSALSDLGKLEPRVLSQVVRRLRLLVPRGLALLATFPSARNATLAKHEGMDDFRRVAREAIMNVRARPVEVYGQQSLRPVQAAWFTLEAFELPCASVELYEGGGQRQALHQGLFLPYHRHTCWHWPVAPARLSFALLCCAQSSPDGTGLRRAARGLRMSHGLVSPQMRDADSSGLLGRLEQTLNQLEAGRITPTRAQQSIQG